MKTLTTYINEKLKDKLIHFVHKALMPDTTVKTKDYLREIFDVAIDKSKKEYIKSNFLNLRWHDVEDLIDGIITDTMLIQWKYIKDNKSFEHPKTDNWDTSDIKDDDYVIPYGQGMKRIDSGDPFTIIPLVIDKDALYSMGAAYRDGKIIKNKEDIYKYIIKPAEDVI